METRKNTLLIGKPGDFTNLNSEVGFVPGTLCYLKNNKIYPQIGESGNPYATKIELIERSEKYAFLSLAGTTFITAVIKFDADQLEYIETSHTVETGITDSLENARIRYLDAVKAWEVDKEQRAQFEEEQKKAHELTLKKGEKIGQLKDERNRLKNELNTLFLNMEVAELLEDKTTSELIENYVKIDSLLKFVK